MSAQRTERLLNLVLCLLAARRFVTREQIRTAVPGYATCESDEAFERMFERDKDDLREMGVPLETGSNDIFFDDEVGYRIPRDAYSLPEVSFDAEEVAVLGLAARVWQQATLSDAASSAVRKLAAGGVDVDLGAWSVVEPRVGADEPAFATLYEAVRDRFPVSFPYRTAGSSEVARRQLAPWGIVSWRGRWYVVGHDADRDDTRVFRLSRVAGEVTPTGDPGSVRVPATLDLGAAVRRFAPSADAHRARLRVRSGAATPLRRGAAVVEPGDGWDLVEVGFTDVEALAGEVCGYGQDVRVVSPDVLREAVVRRLGALVAVLTDEGSS
ncbi:MAG: WYL domain-containing protein [Actinomycetota bacterium]|nr:WYL domain-containing protein [Actinomycetota bacterium]MDH4352427.1 WYL domain-containing protein [Actinomycetota bacterium]MDH5278962.1 WYL domain-containing protein [Actinomycetota bacterium]